MREDAGVNQLVLGRVLEVLAVLGHEAVRELLELVVCASKSECVEESSVSEDSENTRAGKPLWGHGGGRQRTHESLLELADDHVELVVLRVHATAAEGGAAKAFGALVKKSAWHYQRAPRVLLTRPG